MPIPEHIVTMLQDQSFAETSLDLSSQNLNDSDATKLAALLQSAPHVSQLVLCENNIGRQGLATLAAVKSLKSLDVRENNLKAVDLSPLLASSLEKIDLSSNPIGDAGIEILAKSQTLLELEVSDCDITGVGATNFFSLNHSVKILNLSENDLHGSDLCSIQANNTLQQLDLTHCQLLPNNVVFFPLNRSLHSVNFSSNNLGDQAAHTIAQSATLQVCNLAHNNISDRGIQSLATSKTLKTLILFGNQITNEGLSVLITSPSITFLNLQNNQLKPELLKIDDKECTFETVDGYIFTRDENLLIHLEQEAKKNPEKSGVPMSDYVSFTPAALRTITSQPVNPGIEQAENLLQMEKYRRFLEESPPEQIQVFFDTLMTHRSTLKKRKIESISKIPNIKT